MADFDVQQIFSEIDRLAPSFGVDPSTAKSIIIAENTKDGRIRRSSFSGDATNSNRTMGIGQVIPSTARGLQQAGLLPTDWKFDPNDLSSQLSASLATMKDMKSRMKNPDDPYELGAYYNGGTHGWKTYQSGGKLVPETEQYLQKMKVGMADQNMTPQQIERAASNPTAPLPSGTRRGSSSSTSTVSSTYDQGAWDDFQRSAGVLNAPGGLFDQGFSALDARGNGMAESGPALIDSILQAGQAAGAQATVEATGKAIVEARRAAILSRANLLPEQQNNRADQALRSLDETSARLDAMRPEIDGMMSVGLFDNPIEYLVNQMKLPGMVNAYNAVVRQQGDAQKNYDAATSIVKSHIDMSQAIDADSTLEVGAAMDRSAQAKAMATARQSQVALQSKSAADALQAVQLGIQQKELSLQQLALTKQTEAIKEGFSEREAKEKGEQAALSDFNILVKAAGGEGINPDRFKQLPAAQRAEILNTTSTKRFGGDFVSALKFVEKYGNIDTMATSGQLAVRTWINDTDTAANAQVTAAQTAALAKGEKNFNPGKVKEATFNALASQYEAAANGNMRGAVAANPYKIDYKTFIKAPDWAANSYVQLMAKYGPDGTEKQLVNYDEQDFLRRAVTTARLSADPAMATKKMAADVSSFYQTASKRQQMATKPQMFGLSTPSKTYPVALPGYSTGDLPKSIDLGDPVAMENFFTRQVAKETAEQNVFSIPGARASSGTFGLTR